MAFLHKIFPLRSIYLQRETNTQLQDGHGSPAERLSLNPENCNKIIISGPDTADKTSLVFQAAVSAASTGTRVTHICTHPLKRLPAQVHGMPAPEPSTMKNVDFLYLEKCEELIQWFASIHTKSRLPGLIIIEDLLTYACQVNEHQVERSLARLCAVIEDGVSWIASKNPQGCSVLMTAPSRITSLASVLQQFKIRVAQYHRAASDPVSELSFTKGTECISVRFQRHQDCLMMKESVVSRSGGSSKVS